MAEFVLDDIDRGILHCLQKDARSITTEQVGEQVGVSPSTVGNRIRGMTDAGVIRGFHPEIDYSSAGYDLHVLCFCRAPPSNRSDLARRALEVSGTVGVSELVSTRESVLVEAIATDVDDLAEIVDQLTETGLEVDRTEVVRNQLVQPFDHFEGAADDSG